jgi:Bacterial regulatory proteins, luxR family
VSKSRSEPKKRGRLELQSYGPWGNVLPSILAVPSLEILDSIRYSRGADLAFGTFLGDWMTSRDDSYPERERFFALNRLADDWYGSPIYPKRWKHVEEAIQIELQRRHVDLGRIVAQNLPAALYPAERVAISEAYRTTGGHLANLIIDDLVGPKSRQMFEDEREVALPETLTWPARLDVRYQVEIRQVLEDRLELEDCIAKANLTDQELRVLEMYEQGYMLKEIAEQLGLDPSTARGHWFNLKKKLRPVLT